jgi:hypothetical protein
MISFDDLLRFELVRMISSAARVELPETLESNRRASRVPAANRGESRFTADSWLVAR